MVEVTFSFNHRKYSHFVTVFAGSKGGLSTPANTVQFIQKCTKNIVNTYESDKESQKNIENVSRLCGDSNITENVTGNNTGNVTKTEPSH